MKYIYKWMFYSISLLLLLSGLGCDSDPVCVEEEKETIVARISDHNYVTRQFFYLETPGDDFHEPENGFGEYYPVIGGEEHDSLELFISLKPTDWAYNLRPRYYFEAHNDPNNDGDFSDGDTIQGWYYLIYEWLDYELLYDYSSPHGTIRKYSGIRLSEPLKDYESLIVRYKRQSRHEDVVQVGDYNEFVFSCWDPPWEPCNDPYIHHAELICPPTEDFVPPGTAGGRYTSTWNMMYRNIYSIEPYNILNEFNSIEIQNVGTGLEVDVYSHEKYLRIFGLDRYGINGEWGNDGNIDFEPFIVNIHHGYISFPTPQPFNLMNTDMYRWFSAGPPYYEVSDSVKTFVDSLDVHLDKNDLIYEIVDWNNVPRKYEIILKKSVTSCAITENVE